MSIILTYHRIYESEVPGKDFYAVSASEFCQQLDYLLESGVKPGGVEPLLNGEHHESTFYVTFDDGTSEHGALVPDELEKRGLKGIFFIPITKIDRPGRVTRVQIERLVGAGHELGCHGYDHSRLDLMGEAELADQLGRAREALRELSGKQPRILAPPGGYNSRRVCIAARAAGYAAIRTMRWGVNRRVCLDNLETIPLHHHLSFKRFCRIVEGRGEIFMRMLYAMKQAAKAIVSVRLYERVRAAMFPR